MPNGFCVENSLRNIKADPLTLADQMSDSDNEGENRVNLEKPEIKFYLEKFEAADEVMNQKVA